MLDFDPVTLELPRGHFIDGALQADPNTPIVVRRPSDGAVYSEVPTADAETVDRAVRNARDA